MGTLVDYSSGVPTGKQVKAAGHDGVIRYLRKNGFSTVHTLTAAEVRDMFANGRTVSLIYEAPQANRMLGGAQAGANDAAWALAQAQLVGITNPRCIYFTADWDVQPAQYALVDSYLGGVARQIGLSRTGLYGGVRIIEHAQAVFSARWFWQTLAWSGGHEAPRTHLLQKIGTVQVGSVGCDLNVIKLPDYGQHPAPASGGGGATDVTEQEMQHIADLVVKQLDEAANRTLAGDRVRGTDFIDGIAKRFEQFQKNPNA